MRLLTTVAVSVACAVVLHGPAVREVDAAPSSSVVPTDYATIQSAIDAASPGDTIRAPARLGRGEPRETSIVEIFDGASVSMSRLTVSGPGAGTCKKGALKAGIRVHGEAHLDFSLGAVRDIHDSPLAARFHSGTGILVGEVPGPTASLDIRYSEVSNYQSSGIVVLGFGSTASITHNTVTGPDIAGGVATDGIEFPVGSVGTISHNTVSGNICPATSTSCGPDRFTQFQHAGILAGGWGPGTVVTHNLVFGNQEGYSSGKRTRSVTTGWWTMTTSGWVSWTAPS